VAGDQPLRTVHRGHPALVHHGDAIAELLRLLHEVGYQDHPGPAVAHRADQVPGDPAGGWVEPLGEPVEEDHLRPVDQRQRDEEPLLLPPERLETATLRRSCRPH